MGQPTFICQLLDQIIKFVASTAFPMLRKRGARGWPASTMDHGQMEGGLVKALISKDRDQHLGSNIQISKLERDHQNPSHRDRLL